MGTRLVKGRTYAWCDDITAYQEHMNRISLRILYADGHLSKFQIPTERKRHYLYHSLRISSRQAIVEAEDFLRIPDHLQRCQSR
jgi:hypothetical protein